VSPGIGGFANASEAENALAEMSISRMPWLYSGSFASNKLENNDLQI